MRVGQRMRRNVATASPAESLHDARGTMRARNVRQLPVVDGEGRLAGILSDRDIREALLSAALAPGTGCGEAERTLRETPVEQAMTRRVVTADPADALEDAIALLHDFRFNALPVVDERGRVTGIIARTDVLGAVSEALGAGRAGSRLDVTAPDVPGVLAHAASVVAGVAVDILSVVSAGDAGEGTRAIAFRLATLNPAPVREALEASGFTVSRRSAPPEGS